MRLLRLVTKLTLTVKAAFIHKILCFGMFKIIFGQLVDRMLENKRLFECEPPPPPHHPKPGECTSGAYFWPYHSGMVLYLLS